MIRLALVCLFIAAGAALLGFGGIAGILAGLAKALFLIAISLFAILLTLGLMAARRISKAIKDR